MQPNVNTSQLQDKTSQDKTDSWPHGPHGDIGASNPKENGSMECNVFLQTYINEPSNVNGLCTDNHVFSLLLCWFYGGPGQLRHVRHWFRQTLPTVVLSGLSGSCFVGLSRSQGWNWTVEAVENQHFSPCSNRYRVACSKALLCWFLGDQFRMWVGFLRRLRLDPLYDGDESVVEDERVWFVRIYLKYRE